MKFINILKRAYENANQNDTVNHKTSERFSPLALELSSTANVQ